MVERYVESYVDGTDGVTQAKYNDLLQLKYKTTKDGRKVLILPKRKVFWQRVRHVRGYVITLFFVGKFRV